uniref:Uncharacterized protein n=1 Tax=Panagrolaimus superbus TaxID=310955 RepID=A0A914XRI1_9BILA
MMTGMTILLILSFDKDIEADDCEVEEIGTEVSEINKDDSISANILATDASPKNGFPSALKDQYTPNTPAVKEIPVDTQSNFRKIAFHDGSESDEEEYRLENCAVRSENVLFNFVSMKGHESKDAEKMKKESLYTDENTEIVQYSDDVDDFQDSGTKAKSNIDFENFADKEINNDEIKASEVLPLVKEIAIIEKGVHDIGYAEMDEYVENKEIKIPEKIIETSNFELEDGKNSDKNSIQRKNISSNVSFYKQKSKKIPNFTARMIPRKKCCGSESDEEDVRMENTISVLHPVEISKTEKSAIDIPNGKLKTVFPKAVTNANKSSKLPRAFGAKIKSDIKPQSKSTEYIPPANQKADLSKAFDEME